MQKSISWCTGVQLLSFVWLSICLMVTGPTQADGPSGALGSAKARATSVTIHRDSFGVPHVFAATDADCVFGFIYAQAEDYFWQIEDSYLRSLGRAAEIYGEKSLADDLVNRALEIPRLAREEYEKAPGRTKEFCNALADGLNYFLTTHPQTKPRLITHFEPWHPLAFRRYMLYQAFIYRMSGLSSADIIGAVKEIKDEKLGAVDFSSNLMATLQLDSQATEDMASHTGSNMWAISPKQSASSNALLFINPHQPFFGPGQWYEGHLVSGEGWNLLGACFFGSPYPTIGYNGHIAWSHTVNNPGIVSTYLMSFDDPAHPLAYRFGEGTKLARTWDDTITVKENDGLTSRRFRFTKTDCGPIVGVRNQKPIAVKLARLEEGGALEEWYAMGKAKTVAEFKAAMKPCAIPMFNAMVADAQGNIFYVYNGAIPKRNAKLDWSKPLDGSDPETRWQGYHTFDELPQLENPKCGFLQNCNQQPFTTLPLAGEMKSDQPDDNLRSDQFPSYFCRERERDNGRARVSRRILAAQEKFSFEDWAKAGWNTKVIEAEARVPELVKEWQAFSASEPERAAKLKDAIEILQKWDGTSTVDSVAMTLFALTYDKVMQMVQKRDLFNSPRIRALEATIADLVKSQGTWKIAWGEINRLQRIHGSEIDLQGRGAFRDDHLSLPVAGSPGPLGIVFSFYSMPQTGQKRRYGVAGHSYVGVVELGPTPRAMTILQFGQSGDPNSRHWFDQAELYSQGKFKSSWFSKEEIAQHCEGQYHPGER